MKKNVLLLMASTLVCLVACNKETELPNDEPTGQSNDVITEVIGAGLEKDETKADISDGLKFSWRNGADRAGDYVAFWNGTTYVRSAASTAAAASTTFEITYSGTRSKYAYYPYYIVQDIATEVNGTGKLSAAGTTTVVLPDTYDYAEVSGTNTPCPMIAANTAGAGWAFKQLCGLLRLTVPGIPATANKLVITFDKVVTGAFNVTGADTATPYISVGTGESAVTITLTPGADYCGAVVNIPVPAGTVSVTSVVAKKDGDLVATSITSPILSEWSAARKHGKKATAAFTPSMYSMVFAPGNLYTEGGTLKMASNYYSHAYAISNTNDFDLTDLDNYNVENRTHFNFNETYWLMKGTKPTMELANANVGTEPANLSMTRSDFGDDYTWRVPTHDDWVMLSTNLRPGTKLAGDSGYRFVTAVVSGMGTSGTSIAEPTFAERNAFSGSIPNTNYQAGLLIFPDNVVLSGDYFDVLGGKNAVKGFYPTKITKDNLKELIDKGCFFLPSVGSPSTSGPIRVGFSAHYWASTITSGTHAYSFIIFSHNTESQNQVNWSATASKPGNFRSVRLIRDLN